MSRLELEKKYDEVLNTKELQQVYSVKSFSAPFAFVTHKTSGESGTIEFQHEPRFYFNFQTT